MMHSWTEICGQIYKGGQQSIMGEPSSFLSGHEGAARKRFIHIFPIHKHGYRPKKKQLHEVMSSAKQG